MECTFCKEMLDERDVRDRQILSCWKCGLKRELTTSEKIKLYAYESDFIYGSYYKDQIEE